MNKAFFFGSYQGTFDKQLAQRFGTVPTAAMRTGDFSASPMPIYDPLTGAANGSGRTAFHGNLIPSTRVDQIALKLLADLPLANQPGLADNYSATGNYTFDRHNVDANVNDNATNALTLVARVGWLGYEFRNPPMFGALGSLPVNSTAAKAGTGFGDTYTFTGSASYVVTSTFLIDAYFGLTTIGVNSEPDRLGENLGLDYLGIPGTNGSDRLHGGWPHFTITNYSTIDYAGSSHSPYIDDNWQVQYTGNATWTKGAQSFKFSGDVVRQALNRLETNQMLICGIGDVPNDCGYDMGPGNVSPRAGVAYRVTETLVVRGGYGINYDPYPLAFVRNILGNDPSSISLSVPQPNALQPAGRLRDGIPAIAVPDISAGVIPVPLNVSARALPDEPKRGYIHSWNVTAQAELPWKFTGQVGYVATRQRDINQIMDANAGQVIGAGNGGRPLFVRFGRTGATGILRNPGWSDYDSLQAAVTRRLAQGLQVHVAYTWSRAFGICCDTLSDNPPMVQALDYFSLNDARLPQDRPHNFQTSFVAELPFGPGKPLLNQGGVGSAVLGGWQVNGLLSRYSGSPFTVTSSGTSLDLPGSTQVADQLIDEVRILGGIGANQPWFDTTAFRAVTERRFGTAAINSMRGPGFANFDLSVFRDFGLGCDRTIQFRMEAFNLTNTPHFANPQASVNAANFGVISSTANTGREGIDERLFRIGVRIKF